MPTYLSTRRSSTVYDSTVPTLRPFRDATGVVVVAVLLAYLLPTQLVFLPLSSLGRPGLVVGLGLLIWWLVTRLHPELATHGRQPMRWALLGYLAALGASYLAGQLRGLPALEQNGADRAILATLAGGGIMLAVADGVLNRERIERILRWLCWASSGMALVALGQFALRIDLTVYMRLPPLLVFQRDPVGFDARGGGGLVRVAGTAGHYIEFSVLMVIGLLIAIHLARFAPSRRSRQLFGALAMVQAAVIPISLSRTGVLALAAAILLLLVAWPLRTSFNVLALGLVLAVVIQVVRPGLLATLRALILVGNRDPSVQGRLEDYDYVRPYFEGRPWFGRGVGTWLIERYQLLDNQWLLSLVTTGIVGTAALALLLLTGIFVAVRVRMCSSDAADRDLAVTLAVAIAVAGVTAATFDALHFSTYRVALFLLLGLVGALWRITRAARINESGHA